MKNGNNTIVEVEFNGTNYNLYYRAGTKSCWGINPGILENSGIGKIFQYPHPFELSELKDVGFSDNQLSEISDLKKWQKFFIN